MLNPPWFNIEEGIQRLKEIEMLEQICHLRPTQSHWESLEGTSFIKAMRNKFVREAPASLKSSVIDHLCRHCIRISVVTELENLNTMGVAGSQVCRAKWWHSIDQRKVNVVIVIDSRIKAPIRIACLKQTYGID